MGDHPSRSGGTGPELKPGTLEHALHVALTADPPDPAAVHAARAALVAKWEALASREARRWYERTGRGDPADYFAAAVAGLWVGATRFDPAKGYKFPTFAGWEMENHLRKLAHQEAAGGCHVPQHHGLKKLAVAVFGELTGDDGTLDYAGTVAAPDPDPREESPDEAEFWDAIDEGLPDERERLVLRRRFKDGAKLNQIAAELGVTPERVRQIEVKALAGLATQPQLFEELRAG